MTMSIGCALLTQGEQIDDAIKRADGGLYAAKHGGVTKLSMCQRYPEEVKTR